MFECPRGVCRGGNRRGCGCLSVQGGFAGVAAGGVVGA